jgi:hypothetical protein
MTKFNCRKDLEEYLSGDRLQCFICGKSYINLGSHVGYGHKIQIKEYKETFGIPASVGLLARPFKQTKSKDASENPLIKKSQFKKGHKSKRVKRRKQPDWCYDESIRAKPAPRKLTPEVILEIFISKETHATLAKKHGVGAGTINRIKNKNHWFFKGNLAKA